MSRNKQDLFELILSNVVLVFANPNVMPMSQNFKFKCMLVNAMVRQSVIQCDNVKQVLCKMTSVVYKILLGPEKGQA